ncbi:hypothetical protein ZIOFF_017862 [Zingiber officinale]|uniref:Sulfite exporter TauE/SafE family protein n=1 Tax=Zingiber officinale TaxID=94328 RepID=A0A8J5LII3_ZINOF|nr:hypothetical protein ZIOFF_017862 [Zingiber officinale]
MQSGWPKNTRLLCQAEIRYQNQNGIKRIADRERSTELVERNLGVAPIDDDAFFEKKELRGRKRRHISYEPRDVGFLPRPINSAAHVRPSSTGEAAIVGICFPALAWENVLYAKGGNYNAHVVIPDDKPDESLLWRFTREVMKAGVLQECKIRRWFENTVEKKKRKVQDVARKNRRWYVSNFHFFRKRKLGSFVAFVAKAHDERAKVRNRADGMEMDGKVGVGGRAWISLPLGIISGGVIDKNSYKPVWPPMEFGWKIVVGSMIGFFGAAFGSVGGVGGGGIFMPMLALIVGFDPKSTTAISKCMIMGAAGSTVYYNLKLRHPSLHMAVIDYDLALLIQPMLMLGISIGVIFNGVFPDWMVTVLLIVLFIGTSTKAFMKGVDTWKLETILKREAAKRLVPNGREDIEYAPLPMTPTNTEQKGAAVTTELEAVCSTSLKYILEGARPACVCMDVISCTTNCKGMMNLFASRCDGGGSSMLVVVHGIQDSRDQYTKEHLDSFEETLHFCKLSFFLSASISFLSQLFNLFEAHKDPRQNPIAYSCIRLRKTSYFFSIVDGLHRHGKEQPVLHHPWPPPSRMAADEPPLPPSSPLADADAMEDLPSLASVRAAAFSRNRCRLQQAPAAGIATGDPCRRPRPPPVAVDVTAVATGDH